MNRIVIFINITLLCISCTKQASNGQYRIFRYNCSNGITSLDPAFARNQDNIWACSQIFNGLVETDSHLQIKPSIANSWHISSNGLIYTFYLKTNVYFHPSACFGINQTRHVVAKDVVFSLNRIRNPLTASPGAWIFNGKVADNGIVALNDTVVQITLLQPFPPFLGLLSMQYCSVVPFEVTEKFGKDFGLHPIGTGPFIFKDWHENVKLNLIANNNYFEKKNANYPRIDGISVSFMQSRQTEFMALLQGDLDMINGIETSYKDEIFDANGNLQSKYAKKFSLIKHPFLNTEYLAINMQMADSLNMDLPFRQAINLAVDKEKMLKYLRNNIGIAANKGFVPPGLPGASDTILNSFNRQLAERLLKKSKWDKTQVFTIVTTADYLDLCLYIQKQLQQIGLKVQLETLPSSIIKSEKAQGRLAVFRASWIADYPDAENYLSCFIWQNRTPQGPNYTFFHHPMFEKLYALSQLENKSELRYRLYDDMNRILSQECPVIPLFYDESVRIYSKRVKGYVHNSLNGLMLKQIELAY